MDVEFADFDRAEASWRASNGRAELDALIASVADLNDELQWRQGLPQWVPQLDDLAERFARIVQHHPEAHLALPTLGETLICMARGGALERTVPLGPILWGLRERSAYREHHTAELVNVVFGVVNADDSAPIPALLTWSSWLYTLAREEGSHAARARDLFCRRIANLVVVRSADLARAADEMLALCLDLCAAYPNEPGLCVDTARGVTARLGDYLRQPPQRPDDGRAAQALAKRAGPVMLAFKPPGWKRRDITQRLEQVAALSPEVTTPPAPPRGGVVLVGAHEQSVLKMGTTPQGELFSIAAGARGFDGEITVWRSPPLHLRADPEAVLETGSHLLWRDKGEAALLVGSCLRRLNLARGTMHKIRGARSLDGMAHDAAWLDRSCGLFVQTYVDPHNETTVNVHDLTGQRRMSVPFNGRLFGTDPNRLYLGHHIDGTSALLVYARSEDLASGPQHAICAPADSLAFISRSRLAVAGSTPDGIRVSVLERDSLTVLHTFTIPAEPDTWLELHRMSSDRFALETPGCVSIHDLEGREIAVVTADGQAGATPTGPGALLVAGLRSAQLIAPDGRIARHWPLPQRAATVGATPDGRRFVGTVGGQVLELR